MELWERLLSEDEETAGKAIDEFIRSLETNKHKEFAQVAKRYYLGEHDIKNKRIFFLDEHNNLVEDNISSNIKISHPFFMEITDQKVQFMLSNGVRFLVEDERQQEMLDSYTDEDFQLFMNKMVEGVSVKGVEFAYASTRVEDRISFQTSDYLQTETILDDELNEVAVLRYFEKETLKEKKYEVTKFAEVYTEENVTYFIKKEKDRHYYYNPSVEMNPRPHIVAVDNDGQLLSRNYGEIPFYRLSNNLNETSDLSPIKDLIDDYDLMSSFLSNNLQDYDKPIMVVSGYQGDNTSELKRKIMSTGVVRVGAPNTGGTVDLKTYRIPYEARKAKMEMDKESIYKFGMAFDSSQVGDGNTTNIVIKSRYSLLELKANKLEPRVMAMLKWCLELILQDIERVSGTVIDIDDIEIEMERVMMFNELENAEIALREAQKQQTLVSTLSIAAGFLDMETLVMKLAEVLDVEYEDIINNLDELPRLPEGDVDGATE